MTQYFSSEILEPFEPEKDILYTSFVEYFNNPLMTKIKNVDKYSMYMCKNYCLLSNQCRYIVSLVPIESSSLGSTKNLSELKWISIQTRTLSENYNIDSHSYTARRGSKLDCEISRLSDDDKCSTYKCEKFPITITLLHVKGGINEYQEKGNIITALETYNTIITLNN
jgi:hypothetical protein